MSVGDAGVVDPGNGGENANFAVPCSAGVGLEDPESRLGSVQSFIRRLPILVLGHRVGQKEEFLLVFLR